MIRCVAFDVVGTLLQPDPRVGRIYAEVGRRHGSRKTEAEVTAAFRRQFARTEEENRAQDLRTSEARERRRWRQIVAALLDDANDPQACFDELFAHFARPEAWAACEAAPETLAELRRRHLGLAVCSNFDRRLYPILDGHPELGPFDAVCLSSEIGWRKPHRNFFAAAQRAIAAAAHEIVLVGDDRRTDYDGARSAGWHAVLIDRRSTSLAPPGPIRHLSQLARWLDAHA